MWYEHVLRMSRNIFPEKVLNNKINAKEPQRQCVYKIQREQQVRKDITQEEERTWEETEEEEEEDKEMERVDCKVTHIRNKVEISKVVVVLSGWKPNFNIGVGTLGCCMLRTSSRVDRNRAQYSVS